MEDWQSGNAAAWKAVNLLKGSEVQILYLPYKYMSAKKSEQLGMPFGTACNRLRKKILYAVLTKTHSFSLNCYHCHEYIGDINKLSIEHKKPWLDSDISLFWDLDNIAFSHLSCNSLKSRRHTKPYKDLRSLKDLEAPEDQKWCGLCKSYKPIAEMTKNKSRRSGFNGYCKICFKNKYNTKTLR